jgi:hypothetical protein
VEERLRELEPDLAHMNSRDREDVVSGHLRWTDLTPAERRERDERAVAELRSVHGDVHAMRDCLRVDLQPLALQGDQEASLGSGVLDGRAHEPVDQLFQNHFAGDGLRYLNHGREVELFDQCLDRTAWSRRALVPPQPRMKLIKLPHLSVCSPSEIAPPRIPKVQMRDLPETARSVKAGSQLVGKRLVMDEAVCASRYDGALVQVHGIQRASLDPGNFSANQRCTILEVLRTIRRPGSKLSLVPSKCLSIFRVRVGSVASHRAARERAA